MKIHGLQKMTLLDFPGKVACTVFIAGCDFRCPFCHNSELLDAGSPAEMDDAALLKFLESRKSLLEGVAFTGGEPLMNRELPRLLREIKAMGYPVKLDTNGNHPDRLIPVVEEGLVDYVAMDVKNSRERYAETIGFEKFGLERIDESIKFLLSGKVPYEFRTTCMKEFHDAESFMGIREWIKGAEHYYLQNFVDRDTVLFGGLHGFEESELQAFRDIMKDSVKAVDIRM